MGLLFQVPVGILAATRAGVVSRRASCAATAATPCSPAGWWRPSCRATPITLLLETVPLYLLFELSLLLAAIGERRAARAERNALASAAVLADGETPPA